MPQDASPTATDPSLPFGERRAAADGIYELMLRHRIAMEEDGLSQIEPSADLKLRRTFYDNEAFVNNRNEEARLQLIGEFSQGTNVHPTGNHVLVTTSTYPHFIPEQMQRVAIGDKDKVKWNWTLRCPTNAPPDLEEMWHNQVTTLFNAIQSQDLVSANTIWVSRSVADELSDLIHMSSEHIYKSPSRGHDIPSQKMVKKHSFSAKRELSGGDKSTRASKKPISAESSTPTLSSDDSQATVSVTHLAPGALLPPSLLPGYGGHAFDHSPSTKLVMKDIRDPDNNLIPPSDWWKWIVEGNLVYATVDMYLYNINGRKSYVLTMKTMQILDKSDVTPVMPDPRPIEPTLVVDTDAAPLSPEKSTSQSSPGKINFSKLLTSPSRGKKREAPEEIEDGLPPTKHVAHCRNQRRWA
ncbi:hypothetical protein K435DRAFT_853531 [Dendrothele bispora CBS 962.96]|uniref:Uncharacterized protein n=1 Tax=Dendrothele bispora (strain CBS 962.96) TaxID=1314807 RepID=A0A4S8MGN7_DENBC|nr:hypothetical protein K435DRAFT_853531 [Dendrothele bispora CBS 962.96]